MPVCATSLTSLPELTKRALPLIVRRAVIDAIRGGPPVTAREAHERMPHLADATSSMTALLRAVAACGPDDRGLLLTPCGARGPRVLWAVLATDGRVP
jgi:hypothetical protein